MAVGTVSHTWHDEAFHEVSPFLVDRYSRPTYAFQSTGMSRDKPGRLSPRGSRGASGLDRVGRHRPPSEIATLTFQSHGRRTVT